MRWRARDARRRRVGDRRRADWRRARDGGVADRDARPGRSAAGAGQCRRRLGGRGRGDGGRRADRHPALSPHGGAAAHRSRRRPTACRTSPHIGGSFYFKPEAGGRLWLSPHDETPIDPCDAAPEEIDVAIAIDRFEEAVDWRVEAVERAGRACAASRPTGCRSMASTRASPGFFWCAGQGGFGIQTAPAAALLAAALLLGARPTRRSRRSTRDAMRPRGFASATSSANCFSISGESMAHKFVIEQNKAGEYRRQVQVQQRGDVLDRGLCQHARRAERDRFDQEERTRRRRSRTSDLASARGVRRVAGQLVGAFVVGVAGVALDPDPVDRGAARPRRAAPATARRS